MNKQCFICNSKKITDWAIKNRYKSVQCGECGLIWIDPLPGIEEINDFYQGYYQDRIEDKKSWEQRLVMYQLENQWLEQFIDHGKILDIGCSDGSFLSVFSEKWDRYGIEIEKAAAQKALEKNITVKQGTIETASFNDVEFDCVIMRGTIEHFIDPKQSVAMISRQVKAGGYIFITATPDGSAFCADLYREKWNQFTPPEHLFYFNIKSLSLLMEQFGFIKTAQHHFYPETPYADIKKDHEKVLSDWDLIQKGLKEQVTVSPAFWGNMMTVLYKKVK